MSTAALTPIIRSIRTQDNDDTRDVLDQLAAIRAALELSTFHMECDLDLPFRALRPHRLHRLIRPSTAAAVRLARRAGHDPDRLVQAVYRSWYSDEPEGATTDELLSAIPQQRPPASGIGGHKRLAILETERVFEAVDRLDDVAARWAELDGLTPLQLRVLVAVAGTRNGKEACELLGIQTQTLKNHITRIRRHFGLHDDVAGYGNSNQLIAMTVRWLMERGGIAPAGDVR